MQGYALPLGAVSRLEIRDYKLVELGNSKFVPCRSHD